jgi:hypothetical protein
MKLFAIFLLTITGITACSSTHLSPISNRSGYTYFGSYKPVEPKSLAEVPAKVRLKLLNHLRDRLGSFSDRLTFAGGQIVDFERLARDQPDSKDFRWEVPAYDLHFAFQMPEIGVQSYTAQIKLRSDGSVLEEIDLPAFSTSPEKLKFISLQRAASIAVGRGYKRKHLCPQIIYFKDSDALVWEFAETTSDDGLMIEYKNIYVSAHNGEILKEFTSSAIR